MIYLAPRENGDVVDADNPRQIIARIDVDGSCVMLSNAMSFTDFEWYLWRDFLAADEERSLYGTDWRQEDYPECYIKFFERSGYWKRED